MKFSAQGMSRKCHESSLKASPLSCLDTRTDSYLVLPFTALQTVWIPFYGYTDSTRALIFIVKALEYGFNTEAQLYC